MKYKRNHCKEHAIHKSSRNAKRYKIKSDIDVRHFVQVELYCMSKNKKETVGLFCFTV